MSIFQMLDYRRRAFESADEANRLRCENSELQEKLERAEQQRDAAIARSCELAGRLSEMAAMVGQQQPAPAVKTGPSSIDSGFENGRAVVQREMISSISEIAEQLSRAHDSSTN